MYCLNGESLFPIRDENPSSTFPHVTRLLILANVIVFLVTYLYGGFSEKVFYNYGLIPLEVLKGEKLYTFFSSMFLHGGFLHLFGNMVYLYIFGDNVEDAFGHGRYVLFYFLCGLAADAIYILSITNPAELAVPTIGASGAISGVLGAYAVLYPKARIITLVFYGWAFLTAVPAIFFLGFWFVMQWLLGIFEPYSGVAYWAHIGGFLAGMVLAFLFRRRKKPKEVLPLEF